MTAKSAGVKVAPDVVFHGPLAAKSPVAEMIDELQDHFVDELTHRGLTQELFNVLLNFIAMNCLHQDDPVAAARGLFAGVMDHVHRQLGSDAN